jgi:hypothetical protein
MPFEEFTMQPVNFGSDQNPKHYLFFSGDLCLDGARKQEYADPRYRKSAIGRDVVQFSLELQRVGKFYGLGFNNISAETAEVLCQVLTLATLNQIIMPTSLIPAPVVDRVDFTLKNLAADATMQIGKILALKPVQLTIEGMVRGLDHLPKLQLETSRLMLSRGLTYGEILLKPEFLVDTSDATIKQFCAELVQFFVNQQITSFALGKNTAPADSARFLNELSKHLPGLCNHASDVSVPFTTHTFPLPVQQATMSATSSVVPPVPRDDMSVTSSVASAARHLCGFQFAQGGAGADMGADAPMRVLSK